MINQNSLDVVAAATFGGIFCRPCYSSYCFSRLPDTIKRSFGICSAPNSLPADALGPFGKQYRKVILIFIDAFGWRFFEQFKDRFPVFGQLAQAGVLSKLTSLFPSATTGCVSTIHTGLPASEHGLLDWPIYDPVIDDTVSHLIFSRALNATPYSFKRDLLSAEGWTGEQIFPRRNLYLDLQAHGIESHVFEFEGFRPSPFLDTVCRGATVTRFGDFAEGLGLLSGQWQKDSDPAYFILYFDKFDSVLHRYGPNSPEALQALTGIMLPLERFVSRLLNNDVRETLLMVTADHGHIEVNPQSTFYVDEEWPEIRKYLRRNTAGKPLLPGGGGRDLTLYLEPQYLGLTAKKLRELVNNFAQVHLVRDLVAEGLYGAPPYSRRFMAAAGDLLVLPFTERSVWWSEDGKFRNPAVSAHEGLSRQEMVIPLFILGN